MYDVYGCTGFVVWMNCMKDMTCMNRMKGMIACSHYHHHDYIA
ncbi:hypothetical protein Mpsy_2814 [Methanolobus psychrophilus R15]|nr:hypothetical protein Mpsy_2814 [Methanolobus psychrophilus R15]